MKTVLMVAEKPSLAASIAKILSNGSASSRKGISAPCTIFDYVGTFKGQKVNFKMTSVCGHVMALNFTGAYNNWDSVDPVELFQAPTVKKEAMPELRIPSHLEKEAKGIDYLVLWLDCDKEGENICFEVIDCVERVMRKPTDNQQQYVFRAKFSAITDKDIKLAMSSLGSPNKDQSLSVDARQELDLRVGCAFTRYQTRYFQGKYGNLDSSLISYGPCQTPTLGFCVRRHDQIQTFKPETYWVLQVKLAAGRILEWQRGRIFDKEVASVFLDIVKKGQVAEVVCVEKKEKAKQRPLALNTVELLRIASSRLGIGPQQTMHVAEKLYIQGYISYPRTETTHYPDNYDLKEQLVKQKNGQAWGTYVTSLLQSGINKPRKGVDAGDHPPITPMKSGSAELQGDALRIYNYIVSHFIATVSKDCTYEVTTAQFLLCGESFSCESKTVKEPGFTAVLDTQIAEGGENFPRIDANEKVPVEQVSLVEKQTSPPDYLSEAELISLMEKHGIGTDASIPTHINNICQRNYVTVTQGRKLVPTPLGVVLVHGYEKLDAQLVLPTVRSSVEKQLALIADGKVEFDDILEFYTNIFEEKFKYFSNNIHNMDELFECSFTKLSESGKAFSKCGKCRRYMKYITARPSRLYCMTCNETYSLPQTGIVKLYQELKCPLDDFELLLWCKQGASKSYSFCPYCYSNPSIGDMKKNSGCNQCSHPTCKHSTTKLGVAPCDHCDGMLVLEPYNPPKWFLSCNMCLDRYSICKGAQTVIVSDELCQCGGKIVHATFKDKPDTLQGCAMCESTISDLVKYISPGGGGQSRGGGGGGGGRGRGRGRGGKRGRGKGGRRGGRHDDDDSSYHQKPKGSTNLNDFFNF